MADPTLILVEDDHFLAEGIKRNIEHYTSHRCRIFSSGTQAIRFCAQHNITVALIDLGLPDVSGYHVIEALRELQPAAGQIILTQRSELAHRLKAFREGVDDYLPKPFTMMELVARINALERRLHPPSRPARVLKLAPQLTLFPTHCIFRGVTIPLRIAESTILRLLWEARPGVVPTERLYAQPGMGSTKGALTTLMYRLKKRLTAYGVPLKISCLYKQGYLLEHTKHPQV